LKRGLDLVPLNAIKDFQRIVFNSGPFARQVIG